MTSSSSNVRYQRQLNLPDFDCENQERLLASRVVLVGAGGLGCPLGIYLAAAGIGQITVIDNDNVALSNLHRQIAFTHEEIGQPKAERLVHAMKANNPDLCFEAIAVRLQRENAEDLLQGADLVIDGADNFATKFLIADVCHKLKLPYLTASVFQYSCQMMLCVPNVTPCYRCVFEKPPLDGLQTCTEAGVLGSAVGTAGTIAATEAIKFMAGNKSALTGKLLLYDGVRQSISQIDLDFDRSCRLCGSAQSASTNFEWPEWNISVENCQTLLNNGASLVDVREKQEFAQAHLPSAISVPYSRLDDKLEQLRSIQAPIILYCQRGVRSQQALRKLVEQGLHSLYSLDGGIEAWHFLQTKNTPQG